MVCHANCFTIQQFNLYIYIQLLIFMFNKIFLYSTFYFCVHQYTFSFNFNQNYFPTNICSTSAKNNFIQQEYLFNFNQNYFHPTIIFVQLHQNYFHSTIIIIQLQQKLFSFNNYNYSTSNMHSKLITWPCFYEKNVSKVPGHSKFTKFLRPLLSSSSSSFQLGKREKSPQLQ